MRATLIFLTVLLSFTSRAQQAPANWKVLTKDNYSIQYPVSWDLDQTGYQGTTFVVRSVLTSTQDLFPENVNLIIHDLRGTTIYLDKLVKQSESTFQTSLSNFKISESKRLKDTAGEYHKIIFTGEQGTTKLKFVQLLRIKGIKAYVLTFAAEQAQFDNYKEIGEKILNSFKIK
ncbi:MAG TPA: hypothetical protein VFU05_04970 [Cyclobacteriaceae bacterium]|nr:hypothetical protein [Cyclobacteriaceae bacterium]